MVHNTNERSVYYVAFMSCHRNWKLGRVESGGCPAGHSRAAHLPGGRGRSGHLAGSAPARFGCESVSCRVWAGPVRTRDRAGALCARRDHSRAVQRAAQPPERREGRLAMMLMMLFTPLLLVGLIVLAAGLGAGLFAQGLRPPTKPVTGARDVL